jgi:hypothetical protein
MIWHLGGALFNSLITSNRGGTFRYFGAAGDQKKLNEKAANLQCHTDSQ